MTDDLGIIPDEELDVEVAGLDLPEEVIGDEEDGVGVIIDEEIEITDEDEELCDLEEHGHAEHAVPKRLCHDCMADAEDDDEEVDFFGDEDDEARYYRNSTDEEADEF